MTEVPQPEALCDVFDDADGQRLVYPSSHPTRLSILIVLSPVAGGLRHIAVRIRDRPTSGGLCFCTNAAAGHTEVLFQRTIQKTTVSFNEAQLPKDCFDGLFGHHVKALVAVFANDQHVGIVLRQTVV